MTDHTLAPWALAFVCFSFFFLYLFLVTCARLQSPLMADIARVTALKIIVVTFTDTFSTSQLTTRWRSYQVMRSNAQYVLRVRATLHCKPSSDRS